MSTSLALNSAVRMKSKKVLEKAKIFKGDKLRLYFDKQHHF